MNSCEYIAVVWIQNSFCDLLTVVSFINHVINLCPESIPCKSGHMFCEKPYLPYFQGWSVWKCYIVLTAFITAVQPKSVLY